MKSLIMLSLTFMYIFGWRLYGVIDIIAITSTMLIILTFIFLRLKVERNIYIFLLFLFVLCLYSFAVVLFNGSTELSAGIRAVRILVDFAAGAALVVLYKYLYKEVYIKKIVFHIVLGFFFHSLIAIIMFIDPIFRSFIYESITGIYDLTDRMAEGYRVYGLTYGLATTSVFVLSGVLLWPLANELWAENATKKLLLIIINVTIVVSIFMIGRSGLLIGIIILPLLLVSCYYKNIFNKKGATIILLLCFGASMTYLLILNLPEHFISYNIRHARYVIFFFLEFGQIEPVRVLLDMYFLPDTAIEVIFGSSHLGRAVVSVPSDVGYIRLIFSIGIVGLFIMLAVFIKALAISIKTISFNRLLGLTTIALIIVSLMYSFKGHGLMTRNIWSVQSIMICICCLEVLKNSLIRKTTAIRDDMRQLYGA